MMRTTLLALIPLFLGAGLAPNASAQSVGVSFGRHDSRGSVAFHLSSHGLSAAYSRSCATPRFSSTRRTSWAPRRTYPVHRTQYPVQRPPERVWVPAGCHREWVPARYETRHDSCGRPYTVRVSEGHWATRCNHGRWEYRHRIH